MSLHPCKECGQQISSDAKVCPHCGKKQRGSSGVGWLLLAIIGVIVFFNAIGSLTEHHRGTTMSPAARAAKQKEEVALGRAVWGARRLRDSMRNPDSFKLTQALVMADGTACYTYRAQNGFGGMDVGYAVLTATMQFKTDEMTGFHALWKKRCASKTGADKTRVVEYGLDHGN